MSKFLLIGSVAAMLCGDCVWGMDESQENLLQQDRQSRGKKYGKWHPKDFKKQKIYLSERNFKHKELKQQIQFRLNKFRFSLNMLKKI